MKNLYFIVSWAKNKERTWSGTCYGLYISLSKYFKVEDIEINEDKISTIKRRWNKYLGRIYSIKYNLSVKGTLKNRLNLTSLIQQKEPGIVFQFSEEFLDLKDYPSYIFQDLSQVYVKYLSEHNRSIYKYSGFYQFKESDIKKRAYMQQEYYKKCKGIFTMGEWCKRDIINRCGICPEKVHAVGGGINLDVNLIKPTNRTNNKILFVGKDFKRKGGYIVYEAFKLLKKEIHDLELYVAGPNMNPIESPINGYYYMGLCDYKELSTLFNKCDVFCMPSYFEAYGLVFIEALCYGLPCIGRNAYEMPFFIKEGENGYLLNNDDPKELSLLIKKLINNKQIKQNVLAKRDEYIKEYSWDNVAKKITDIIYEDNKISEIH